MAEPVNEVKRPGMFISLIILSVVILINSLIIYFMYELEGKNCNCISDWRHDFIKYYAMFIIAWSILSLVLFAYLRSEEHTSELQSH